jgi:division protein CdvB (Snf7/Vps24/ESCRT-III family)
MKKEYLLSRVEETHTKKSVRMLKVEEHIIFVTIFSLIDFKKRLSRRDTDERFHISIAQAKVKNSIKSL